MRDIKPSRHNHVRMEFNEHYARCLDCGATWERIYRWPGWDCIEAGHGS